MNAQNCLEILREIKDVTFATVNDEGKPEARIIDVMIVEKDKLYFCMSDAHKGRDSRCSLREKGFRVTDACIGCGKCMRNCPQQCITKGTPFLIHQEHCLHCGLCYENCPVQAIVRRGE